MSVISYSDAKKLTMSYLREWLAKLPVAKRSAPAIVLNMTAYSVADMIAQVQNDSDTGKRYVNFYTKSLGYMLS